MAPYFREITDEVKMYCYFTQENATADKATLSMTVLKEAFKKWLVTKRPWPTCSSFCQKISGKQLLHINVHTNSYI
jgi:hypothetical protein